MIKNLTKHVDINLITMKNDSSKLKNKLKISKYINVQENYYVIKCTIRKNINEWIYSTSAVRGLILFHSDIKLSLIKTNLK